MDLFAYSQIGDLNDVMRKNNIEVPRLRGLRLMANELKYTAEEIKYAIVSNESEIYESFCTSIPKFDPFSNMHRICGGCTSKIENKYLIMEAVDDIDYAGRPFTYNRIVGIRWDLIHGRARKRLKYALKLNRKRVLQQIETFNKYVGRSDVLYIHARIGGGNWEFYGGPELARQTWFLEKVDDYFDSTYCDIYAKISEVT